MPFIEIVNTTNLQKTLDIFTTDFGLTTNIRIAGISSSGDPMAQIEETDVPSCIGFLGIAIDPATMDIILTPTALIAPIRLSNLGTMFSKILEKPIDNEELLRLIEIYKLNGKFEQFLKDINNSTSITGSVIGHYINNNAVVLNSEVRQKILQAIVSLKRRIGVLSGVINESWSPLSSVYANAIHTYNPSINVKDSDNILYRYSTIEYFPGEKVTEIKCSNILELTKLAADEDDVIFSADTKKALTRLGFDKILTGRELTSIANAVNNDAKRKITTNWEALSATLPETRYNLAGRESRVDQFSMINFGLKNMFDLLVKVAKAYGRGE